MKHMPDFYTTQSRAQFASYLVFVFLIVFTLKFHLLTAVLAGLLVFAIMRRIERSILINRSLSRRAKMLSLLIISTIVTLLILGISLGIVAFVHKENGWEGILSTIIDLLEQIRALLPAWLVVHVPNSLGELKIAVEQFFITHSQRISGMGFRSLRTVVLLILGIAIGMMAAWSVSPRRTKQLPFSSAMTQRFMQLLLAFESIVFAQIKISAINTLLTAIYLLIVLPLLDIHLPYTKTLIGLTFLVGLIPVLGNLISNTLIIAVSATVSIHIVFSSLAFLVVIHKLEYFINAKIIGTRINAQAWEILMAMVVMETLFGAAGVVAAPILYAYLKNELKALKLIGPA